MAEGTPEGIGLPEKTFAERNLENALEEANRVIGIHANPEEVRASFASASPDEQRKIIESRRAGMFVAITNGNTEGVLGHIHELRALDNEKYISPEASLDAIAATYSSAAIREQGNLIDEMQRGTVPREVVDSRIRGIYEGLVYKGRDIQGSAMRVQNARAMAALEKKPTQ